MRGEDVVSDVKYGEWRKSSFSSDSANCVEVLRSADGVTVRDSKNVSGPTLSFTDAEWDAFVRGAKNGEFDRM